jgi:tetratricopeptide (TPR) repeat protein
MRGLLVVAVVVGSVGLAFAEPKARVAKPQRKPVSTLASYKAKDWSAKEAGPKVPVAKDATKPKALYLQGLSAYKAGNYNSAAKKFAAAMDTTSSSPELLYHAAQAYRLKGERGKALELYEHYLEEAPDGGAATVCRWYVERLRATP